MNSTASNILLITSDQQHWRLLGDFTPGLRTPNLDRLARQGTRFDRAYCPNPTCTPTRASMITGLYPSQHGAYSLGTKLPETVPTLGDYLRAAGYDTALVGKAHFQPLRGTEKYPSLEAYPTLQDLDFWRNFSGDFYGFNHVELARNHTDEAHVGQHYAIWMEEKGGKGEGNWRDWFEPPTGNTPAQKHRWNIPEKFHYNTWITERSLARLQHCRDTGENFFLWASYFDPHPSYLVPEPWASMYDPADVELPPFDDDTSRWPDVLRRTQTDKPAWDEWQEPGGKSVHGAHSHKFDPDALRKDIAVYYGMMSMLDHYIGKLLDGLEASGLADDTLVVFTSDHGHYHGQHGLVAKGPFHFEDVIRVPMIVRWPGRVPAGATSDALQTLVDLTPTFLDAAGVDVPDAMSGKSQLATWRGGPPTRDHVLVENRHQQHALNLHTYVDATHKITVSLNPPCGEMYDLADDPGETRNLYDDPAHAELKVKLLERLARAQMRKEPRFMPRVWHA